MLCSINSSHGCLCCQGDVLEVSAGTGRNLPYYRYNQLTSLTLTDTSKYMLWHASQKFREKWLRKAQLLPVSFYLTDAQKLSPPPVTAATAPGAAAAQQQTQKHAAPDAMSGGGGGASIDPGPAQVSSVFSSRTSGFQDGCFDTVVDTFGLCSHGDPVKVLRVRLRAFLRPFLVGAPCPGMPTKCNRAGSAQQSILIFSRHVL
jgi:methyltransferase OMS1